MSDKKRTSVQISTDLFNKFKIACIENNFSIQKLAERSMYLYITDVDFRKLIHEQNNTEL